MVLTFHIEDFNILEKRVLALLPDYIIIRKQGDLHGEKAVEEVIEWMHGKTVVDKQKLREFEELLKNRPQPRYDLDSPYSGTWMKAYRQYCDKIEKEFRELTK